MVQAKKVGHRAPHLWTEAELATLRERYWLDGPQELSRVLGISVSVVTLRARLLGLQKPKKVWTEREDEWLRENLPRMSYQDLASRLGVSLLAVRTHVATMGLRRVIQPGRVPTTVVAKIFGVSTQTVTTWIGHGKLEASRFSSGPGGLTYTVDVWDLRWFLRENPLAIDVRKVNQELFMDLVLGDLDARKEVAKLPRIAQESVPELVPVAGVDERSYSTLHVVGEASL